MIVKFVDKIALFLAPCIFIIILFFFMLRFQTFTNSEGYVQNVLFDNETYKIEIQSGDFIGRYEVVDYKYIDELKLLRGEKVYFTHNTGYTKKSKYYSVLLSIRDVNKHPLPYVHPYKYVYIWFDNGVFCSLIALDFLLILFLVMNKKDSFDSYSAFDPIKKCMNEIVSELRIMGGAKLESYYLESSDNINYNTRYLLSFLSNNGECVAYDIICNLNRTSNFKEFKIWIESVSFCQQGHLVCSVKKNSENNVFPSVVWNDYIYAAKQVADYAKCFEDINKCINEYKHCLFRDIENEFYISEIDDV